MSPLFFLSCRKSQQASSWWSRSTTTWTWSRRTTLVSNTRTLSTFHTGWTRPSWSRSKSEVSDKKANALFSFSDSISFDITLGQMTADPDWLELLSDNPVSIYCDHLWQIQGLSFLLWDGQSAPEFDWLEFRLPAFNLLLYVLCDDRLSSGTANFFHFLSTDWANLWFFVTFGWLKEEERSRFRGNDPKASSAGLIRPVWPELHDSFIIRGCY